MALICKQGETRATTMPGALHKLKATPETIHWGYFSPDIKPALTVKSGDLVSAEAITHHAGDAPDLMMDEAVTRIFTEVPEDDRNPGVHIMTGPIYVEDAKPGDVLEVRYLRMVPRNNYGSNLAANWGYLYKEFGEKERVTIYELDQNTNTASALYAYDFRRQVPDPRHDHQLPRMRPPAGAGRRAGGGPSAPGHGRRRARRRRPGQHHSARRPRRQYRQLADRGGGDDVLSRAGRGRAVLDRRPARQPGRRRDLGHGHRELAERADADRAAQGLRVARARCWRPQSTGSFTASTRI
jgi:hypothetical protein